MSLRRCFLGALAVLSASIVVLAMSEGDAAAATDTKNLLEVDKIAEVDFGGILGTRAGAVAVGMTSGCKVIDQGDAKENGVDAHPDHATVLEKDFGGGTGDVNGGHVRLATARQDLHGLYAIIMSKEPYNHFKRAL
jgi:hypothetical protein